MKQSKQLAQSTKDRKEFFVAKLNEILKEKKRCNPYSEEYLRLDNSEQLHWSRDWGETLYRLTYDEWVVDWDSVDIDDNAEVTAQCEEVVESFYHYTVDYLEAYFRAETEAICGCVEVCGYKVNAMEALRLCDPYAWREEFFNWLDVGMMDVFFYEFVGEK